MTEAIPMTFKARSTLALGDQKLRGALGNIQSHLVTGRAAAIAAVDDFDALRDRASSAREHALDHLDVYLEQFRQAVESAGGTVRLARSAADANDLVADLCRRAGARKIVKGKSMVTEEIGLNDHLERQGFAVVESDLGEYIIQLRRDHPSHIVAPAVHLTREDYAAGFRAAHTGRAVDRDLSEPADLLAEARAELRSVFMEADVGITGANCLIASTGAAVVVTNEGNADLSMTLPRVHIVVAGIEKIVADEADALAVIRVLARSATGQAISAYTTFVGGAAQTGDQDGPREFHVVLVDNGRTNLLKGPLRSMLKCIRCGACMNHCPVYGAVGGHAYGWIYPGPMGVILTPSLGGMARHRELVNASTLCGRCDTVCPVRIPLTQLMRQLRTDEQADAAGSGAHPFMRIWRRLLGYPALYRRFVRIGLVVLSTAARWRLPLLGHWLRPWTDARTLPRAPEARQVRDWAELRRSRRRSHDG